MDFEITVNLDGIPNLKGNLRDFNRRLANGVEIGLIESGKFLKERSNEIAPIETGALIEESFSSADPADGFNTIVTVGYGPRGGKSEPYAVRQHQEFERKRKAGRKWKYLETPTRKHLRDFGKIIAGKIGEQF